MKIEDLRTSQTYPPLHPRQGTLKSPIVASCVISSQSSQRDWIFLHKLTNQKLQFLHRALVQNARLVEPELEPPGCKKQRC